MSFFCFLDKYSQDIYRAFYPLHKYYIESYIIIYSGDLHQTTFYLLQMSDVRLIDN